MSVIIQYNGINPFSNQPTPFVGRTKENISVGERWASKENITLVGQLTGCGASNIIAAQLQLLNGFNKDYQTLQIIENDTGIYSANNVIINGISFDSNRYVGILPYVIELYCYPVNFYSGDFGVLDPQDKWEYNETANGVLEMIHTIAARGINTSSGNSNALLNAKNFVLSRTGFNNFVAPTFILNSRQSGILLEQKENINRLNAVYSITERFQLDQAYPCDYGVLRYTINTQQNQKGFNSASIQGTLQGGINDNFNLLRARFSGVNFYNELMYSADTKLSLNPIPLSKSFTEDPYNKTISFDINYDDNPYPQINTNYSINLQSGENVITVSIDGELSARGDLKNRWEKVTSYFQNNFFPYSLANSGYIKYAGTGTILNPNTSSESVTYDKFNGNISFNYSYQDRVTPINSGFEKFEYNLNFSPPLRRISARPLLQKSGDLTGSLYETFDLGYVSRGSIAIGGNAVPKRQLSGANTLQMVKETINSIYFSNIGDATNIYLESYDIGRGNDEVVNFNCIWSYDGLDVLGNTGNYTEIINL